jgi:DNA repair exonuclease SbcCD ATPase subunit
LDELYAKRLIQEDSIAQIIDRMKPLEHDKEDYQDACDLRIELEQCIKRYEQLTTSLESARIARERAYIAVTSAMTELGNYQLNEDNIVHNKKIDIEVQKIQQNITINKKQVQFVETQLRELHGQISVLEAKKQELLNKLTEVEGLESAYEAYTHYLAAVSRDGIPYDLMGKTIPQIEAEINSILSQIVDFTISLEVDGKNINGKLTYDYDRVWPLENSSGMERFVSSLAIRVALMNVSNLPKSNFMIVDEGFGVLDAEHLHSMQTLFNILKTHFDFIFIVSHLETARDMVDNLIEIRREDGYSQISV